MERQNKVVEKSFFVRYEHTLQIVVKWKLDFRMGTSHSSF